MSRYQYKIEEAVSSRALHILFSRLENEDRPFSMRIKRTYHGIWKVTIKTHLMNLKYFQELFRALNQAW